MMLILLKIWAWLKAHWQIPLLFAAGVFLLIFSRKSGMAEKCWQYIRFQRESYSGQIEELNAIQEKERKGRQENIEKYQEIVKEIDKEHDVEEKRINEEEKTRAKEIIEETDNDQDKLAEKFREEFGFKGRDS